MGNNRALSVKYRFLLALCRLFKLQRIMELPPEKAKKLFAKAYKGVQIPKLSDDDYTIRTESVLVQHVYGVHVTMEIEPGLYHAYACIPLVKDVMPGYQRMIEYIKCDTL